MISTPFNSFNLSDLLHLAQSLLCAIAVIVLIITLSFDTFNMVPKPEDMKFPKNLNANTAGSPESSEAVLNGMIESLGYSPRNLTLTQKEAILDRRSPFRAPPPTQRLVLPPPSPDYQRYPGPQRVYGVGHPGSSVDPRPYRAYLSNIPPPRPRPCSRVVDGCDLARQERIMVINAKARQLRSDESRDREYQKRKAMRAKAVAAQAARFLRNERR